MSATIPNNMLLSDLLKATGYDCPDDLQGKTFNQATSGREADLEANHASSVNVEEYTQPIEITPAEGKDGMEKVTLTLTNIPSGGNATAYAWRPSGSTLIVYLSFDKAPSTLDGAKMLRNAVDETTEQKYIDIDDMSSHFPDYVRVDDDHFTTSFLGSVTTYTRDSSKDFTLW